MPDVSLRARPASLDKRQYVQIGLHERVRVEFQIARGDERGADAAAPNVILEHAPE